MSDELLRERRGPVLVVQLNRPDARNALTPDLIGALGRAMLEAEAEADIRAVVLTATGERAFCAGLDLGSFVAGAAPLENDEATIAFQRLMRGDLSVPLVGAANGTALGGGLELLLGCDVVVASSDARLGFPEVKRGFFPAGSGTSLATRVPLSVALEMTLTGDLITATRARELGLVNAVVAPGEVLPAALALAERIAANAPLGVAACRELVRLHVSDPARARERLDHWRARVFQSEDAREGAAAFVEGRAPVWIGR